LEGADLTGEEEAQLTDLLNKMKEEHGRSAVDHWQNKALRELGFTSDQLAIYSKKYGIKLFESKNRNNISIV